MKIAKLLLILLLLSVIGFAQIVPLTNLKAALVVSTGTTASRGVALSWNYGQITLLVNFNVYRKVGTITDTTPFFKIATTNQKAYIDSQVASWMTYSYYVTAVINNLESMPSNMVQITIPSPPVVVLGKISGHLYDDSTEAPIANGNITFLPAANIHITPIATTTLLLSVKTDNNGNFTARLKAGDYYIYSSAHGYAGEFYDNVKTIQNATKVSLKVNDSLYFNIGLAKMSSIPGVFNNGEDDLSFNSRNNSSLKTNVDVSPDKSTGVNDKAAIINGYELYQNYPNPFNPSSIISYRIPQNSFVTLKVYNILGNEVAALVNEQQTAGLYNYNFNAKNLASGIYIYKFQAGSFTSVKKLTLLK